MMNYCKLINEIRIHVKFLLIVVLSLVNGSHMMAINDHALIMASEPIKSARIVGGTTTLIGNVPYLVYLKNRQIFFCGGSLVSWRHVLTAAHCVKGLKADGITVVGGATYLTETGVQRSVQTIFTPRSYNSQTMSMDVAVLKLKSEMRAPNINVIDLCSGNGNWKPGDFVTVSGWGQTTEKRSSSSNQVRTVDVQLMSKATCKRKYQKVGTITKSMFCAAVSGQKKDACIGDSGGPAVYRGRVCGIVSWGMGCAREKFPGVYTNVNTVKSFISTAMSK